MKYEIGCIDQSGTERLVTIEAESPKEAITALEARGIRVLKIARDGYGNRIQMKIAWIAIVSGIGPMMNAFRTGDIGMGLIIWVSSFGLLCGLFFALRWAIPRSRPLSFRTGLWVTLAAMGLGGILIWYLS